MKVISKKPLLGTRWRAKIGKHTGIEARVVKVGVTMVYLERTYGRVNGSSKRGSLMKLPIDAFWRRYEPISLAAQEVGRKAQNGSLKERGYL